MATPSACAGLVEVLPRLLRARRSLVGTTPAPATATLAAVRDGGAPRLSEVAELLGLDLSTVSRQVAHLRQRGLLTAAPDPQDGRSQRLSLTEAGAAELRWHRRALVETLVTRLADWDDAEIDRLTQLLDRFARSGDPGTGATCAEPAACRATAAPAPHTPPADHPGHHLQRNA
ncbi:winged helix DNA-binding protein [Kineococcus sp. R8]|uniref:MarR family winged helix-turn-helix transcriptional regulator n=1 Tax=Kineococcus siccus TaxID=2696567 RepID=UPI001411C612|nr:MarR family transcriptional regulator [Kineococcus siccus]NAZ80840.1 winged helix DNA-binding protein [Kineococcus siccus]